MNYITYDNQNQSSRQPQQQQPSCTTTPTSHHSHHHLQLQPVSQQHGTFLPPTHHHHTQTSASTATRPPPFPLQEGGEPVPFMSQGSHPIGYAPQEGEEVHVVVQSRLGHDVLSTSQQMLAGNPGRIMENIFSTTIQEDACTDLPASHLEHPVPCSMAVQSTEPSNPGPLQVPSSTNINPATSTATTTIQPSSTPSQSNRRPLSEKAARNDSEENRLKNVGHKATKQGNPKNSMRHAKLPEGFSYQFADKTNQCITGVQVNRIIQKGQWFGPFTGTLLEEEAGKDVCSTWELCIRGDVWFYVDGRDAIHNNWLIHISPARTREEQNLEAFQHYGDIYFRALDTIQPGTELRVFYSDEYRLKIGCKMSLDELNYQTGTGCFTCSWCQKTYHTSKSILRHLKFCHSQEKQAQSKKSNCKETMSKKARLMKALQQAALEKTGVVSPEVIVGKEPVHDKVEDFVCVTCGKHFPTSGRLMAHELFHESTHGKLECSVCNAVFKTSVALMKHKEGHTHSRFMCTICFKQYSCRSHLSRHMDTAHGFERVRGKIVCTGCMKKFDLEDDMLKHLQSCQGLQQVLKERGPVRYIDDRVSDEDDDGLWQSKSMGNATQSLVESQQNFSKEFRARCTICHKYYSSRCQLARHMKAAHGFDRAKGKIVCRGCSRMFAVEENMLLHLRRCKGLQEITRRKNNLRKMLESDRDDDGPVSYEEEDIQEGHPGPDSNKPTQDGIGLQKMLLESDEDDDGPVSDEEEDKQEGYSGPDSNKPAQDGKGLLVDMLGIRSTQDVSKPFKCSYCKERFSAKNRLLRHKREKHPNRSMFKCNKCDLTFPKRYPLKIHLQSHEKEKHFKCQLCPRSFSSESALVSHQVEHTDARPHKCEPCMKGFRTRELLLSHIRRMHRERELRFSCSFCDKRFSERSNLVRHERRHQGIRPHVCLACGKAFTSKHCLISHIRIHTGEKPFKCDICGKCFSLNHHLQQHLVTHKRSSAKAKILQEHE